MVYRAYSRFLFAGFISSLAVCSGFEFYDVGVVCFTVVMWAQWKEGYIGDSSMLDQLYFTYDQTERCLGRDGGGRGGGEGSEYFHSCFFVKKRLYIVLLPYLIREWALQSQTL